MWRVVFEKRDKGRGLCNIPGSFKPCFDLVHLKAKVNFAFPQGFQAFFSHTTGEPIWFRIKSVRFLLGFFEHPSRSTWPS